MSRFELPQLERGDRYAIVIEKGSERYVFLFDDDSKEECLRRAAKFANDPSLSFTWYDAVLVTRKMKSIREQTS